MMIFVICGCLPCGRELVAGTTLSWMLLRDSLPPTMFIGI